MLQKILSYWYILKAALVLAYIFGFTPPSRTSYIIKLLAKKSIRIISYIYMHLSRANRHTVCIKNKESIEKRGKQKKTKQKQSKLLKRKTTSLPNSFEKYFPAYIYLVGYLRDCIRFKCVTARILYYGNVGTALFDLVTIAWICEKLNINLRPLSKDTNYYDIFDFALNYSEPCEYENFTSLREPITHIKHLRNLGLNLRMLLAEFSRHKISSEYGYKIISKLSIKQDLQQQADKWYRSNIKGNCIGVHYRGTDAMSQRQITIESYITYLKKVLNTDSYIFACSEKEQFITQMKAVFPGRIVTRNIRRSQTDEAIHIGCDPQQIQDAFIDILILSKTKLIYTVGSNFTDCVRFLNPAIKIICLQPRNKRISNYLPVPEKAFVEKAKKEYELSKKQRG